MLEETVRNLVRVRCVTKAINTYFFFLFGEKRQEKSISLMEWRLLKKLTPALGPLTNYWLSDTLTLDTINL
jgi:hypothetical protein